MSESEGPQCAHDDAYWELDAAQEKGWRCLTCRAALGFRPDLDRKSTALKVESVLHALHDAGLTYVSTAKEGYQLVREVTEYCRRSDIYDQQGIAYFLLDEQEHKRFWQQAAHRWLEEHEEGTSWESPTGERGTEP